jgi:hypothetical protein
MKELFGIECAYCREAGHRCQAQIWLDGIALCLRCAEDEPCVYVTAAGPTEPVINEVDPCVIPPLTSEDRKAVRNLPPLPSIHATWGIGEHLRIGRELRASIIADSVKLSAAELARKYHVSKAVIQNVKSDHRRKLKERGLVAGVK